ncbi:hypothetical protein [uncultured Piscinibacter sp.]|uniref:hypothetical protein n=1 Tax=uncultured Piscinibacter sp. TaxID=1131835 RepID=UPI002637852A|nr:hypothetical protein [uncultured Piscinibacter sp.]
MSEMIDRLAQHPLPRVGRITDGVGFTERRTGDTPAAGLERADKAVCSVRTHGRDPLPHHADPVAVGPPQDGARAGDVELF